MHDRHRDHVNRLVSHCAQRALRLEGRADFLAGHAMQRWHLGIMSPGLLEIYAAADHRDRCDALAYRALAADLEQLIIDGAFDAPDATLA